MSRTTRTVLVAVVALALIVPIAALASDRFTDVPDSNVFHDDIMWLADAEVTLGCNPPTNDEFCPSDNVTREQMAAFMKRLAVNQVVDAATAIHSETADIAGTAHEAVRDGLVTLTGTSSATADSIATLDGLAPGAYVVMATWNTTAHGATAEARIVCDLSAGLSSTRAVAQIDNNAPGVGQESMAAVTTGVLADGDVVNLSCWRENQVGSQSVSSIRVIAYPVMAVESTAVTQ